MILTYEEIRKAAEFAAAQMWPESGYVGWTEDDAVYHRKFIEACLEKLRGGVELPEAELFTHELIDNGSHGVHLGVNERGICEKAHIEGETSEEVKEWVSISTAIQYGDARALAAREQQWLPIESAPQGTMILCANMKAREAKGWCFVAWVVDGKVCGHRMDMPTHWQPLPPPPASPQEQT